MSNPTHYDLHQSILTALRGLARYDAERIEGDPNAMGILKMVDGRLHDLLEQFEEEDEDTED